MLSFFKRKTENSPPEKSLYFNLEPTFRCNLKCTTCPRNSVEGGNYDMSPQVFSRICGEMKYARAVDFTGWGEPLLHPSIHSMIREASGKGLPVTMTSNATLLSKKMAGDLISSGLDKLAVSIDGMRPETYEAIRKGALYERVCQNVKNAVSLSAIHSGSMEISLAFTIQKENLSDLGLIIPWMKEHGVRVLHLKHLNVISGEFEWERSLIRIANGPYSEQDLLKKAEADIMDIQSAAAREGIQVNFYSQLPMDGNLDTQNCLADPLNAVYFSFDGKISPCCHLGHKVSRYFQESFTPPAEYIAGNITRDTLKKTWNSPGYQEFLNQFRLGRGPDQCRTCYLLYGK